MVKTRDWWVKFDGADDVWIYFTASSDSGNEPYHVLIYRTGDIAGSILCDCMDRKCRHNEGHVLFPNKTTCKHIRRVWQLIDRNKIQTIIKENKEKRKCRTRYASRAG